MKKQLLIVLRVVLIATILTITISCGDNGSDRVPLTVPDPDWDGLTSAQELQLGTDPFEADTDGDTYTDGVEISYDSDPLNELDGPEVWVKTDASVQCDTYCKPVSEAQAELTMAGVTVLEITRGLFQDICAAFCGGPTPDLIAARIPLVDLSKLPNGWWQIDPSQFVTTNDCAWNLPPDLFGGLP